MDHFKTLEKAYKYSLSQRCCIRFFFCCRKAKNDKLNMRLIDNTWPHPEQAILPDNLIWSNMGIYGFNRFIRVSIQWIFAIGLLIGSFYAIFRLSKQQEGTTSTIKIVK